SCCTWGKKNKYMLLNVKRKPYSQSQWFMIGLLNLIVFLIALFVIISQEIKTTESYLDPVFERFNGIVQNVGKINAEDASQVHAVIDRNITFKIPQASIDSTILHENPEQGYFGFNLDTNTQTTPNGTLIGLMPIPDDLKKGRDRFLILDKIWSYYNDETFFDSHFYISYKYHYYYSSKINYKLKHNFNLSPERFEPKVNREGIEAVYQAEYEKYGYFFTLPKFDGSTNTTSMSVISPIFKNGELVGDLGVRFDTLALSNVVSIYPELRKNVSIYLRMRHSNQKVMVSKADDGIWPVFEHTYNIPNLGTIVAQYDVMLFVNQIFSGFVILIVMMVFLNLLFFMKRKSKIEKSLLQNELMVDPMTGLYNRRVIDNSIKKTIQNAHLVHQAVALINFDANKFKYINDTYGHQIGDQAIQHIANTIVVCSREVDFCVRMGGDEFLLVMPNVTLEIAEQVAKRIEDQIASQPIPQTSVYVHVTSACTLLNEGETFDSAFKRSDDILYQKKKQAK
ncbi:MAG: GGDEF domain-containing protein, partial [Vibrio sp.]